MKMTRFLAAAMAVSLCASAWMTAPTRCAEKSTDANAAKPAAASDNLGQRKDGAVGEHEQLSFRQSKVSAEMTELEERMYRLSEALKQLEPENSSRLMSGVKYARAELILHEMQEIESILNKSEYKLAANQEKELLVKLARLEQMLLSADLDLQLQLQRLRAIREILHRLDTAIKEEDREQKLSAENSDRDKQMQNLPSLREKLEELIRRETAHIAAATQLIEQKPTDARPVQEATAEPALPEKLLNDQEKTRDDTKALEERLAELSEARGHMDASLSPLKDRKIAEAVPHQKEALDALKKLSAKLEAKQQELESALSQEKFNGMRKDQEQNHTATDKIAEMTREIGDAGAGALGEITRAGGSMGNAEGHLGGRQPEPAGQQQSDALASLKYAREQLSQEEEKLLNKIRAEIKKRVLEGITEMLERQVSVRESTERLSPKLKEASRQVMTSVVGLSKSEQQIMQIGEGLVALVEETEFGIALPAALRSVIEEMDEVKGRLAGGDASPEVIEAEKQIEADLKALLEAMKQLPAQGGGRQQRGGGQDRQRELNRILAELKMIRILQVRVNRETSQADQKRAADLEKLSAEMRQKIQNIHDRQQDVYDVTDKLNNERGDELQQ